MYYQLDNTPLMADSLSDAEDVRQADLRRVGYTALRAQALATDRPLYGVPYRGHVLVDWDSASDYITYVWIED